MKSKLVMAAMLAGLMAGTAQAENIGVSMALFDDNFLTVLRNGMIDYSKELKDVNLQIEDAQNDVGKQLNQIQNFVASGVDAIIVNPVDTDATAAMTQAAAAAGIPLVYVNREPANVDQLPDKQAFVASKEIDAGTLETQEACRLLKAAGKTEAKIVVLLGELSNQASRMRTQAIKDVIATPDCRFMSIAEEQVGNWSRTQGADLVTNWLSAGIKFDAVLANNDEMAIGAIQALKAANVPMDQVIVGGIDATQDALAAMAAGDLDVTVFQNAAGQGKGAVDAALKLAKGDSVEKKVYVPFELVTPANLKDFQQKN
ncbi:ribose transport system substrate-binding protein/inositol transport system substrate-binding protein [Rhizobium petrolearium]|uniref:sugar ABC transporter substrate-binding protein n=1 Tax=Neorhizobium petrolearium TaxID=515361 RepID=UPI001AE4B749|nr:sugar ABC transporter substrate-binding protein [Neorhizobium petrolearium]MBP1848205.1 ribose transport system substrate-binding protein/inositol transport system substrate-binding protein [Neorhizobium petrolearium]